MSDMPPYGRLGGRGLDIACKLPSQQEEPRPFPHVQGRCPACLNSTLFLGTGGWITCSLADCPNPSVASSLLRSSSAHGPNAQRRHLPPARIAPAEHCGEPKPPAIGGEDTECALRPEHRGSHADDRGCRWRATVRTETGDAE